ncbi:L,D-transpeptidase [Lentilactobacillus kribbianus]|uniref:L,D-transpeptidase n=1 Tax=Lentilactobacillus kribbianus TaxID=2729622 RepID=UPI0015539EBE|nr:L,D-transpeptidase [Lentilactobacillus kribbianus]
MMKKILRVCMGLALVLVIAGCSNSKQAKSESKTDSASSSSITAKKSTTKSKPTNQPKINWRKPSENKPYPKITTSNGRYLQVDIKKQRVYVMSPEKKILYTMYASTGKDNSTPRGTYQIQAERGDFFYNKESKEGAKYWTSWKDHGIYLFHTVPTDENGDYIKAEADNLGKSANSHGCVRLSIPDAKWINQNVPTGTKVVIK